MVLISLTNKETHHTTTETLTGNAVQLPANSPVVVQLDIAKEDIAQIQRSGANAVITLKNGEVIILENFFIADNSLVLATPEGELLWIQFTDAQGTWLSEPVYGELQEIKPLLYRDSVAGAWAWGAVAAGGLGVLAWANEGNDDGDPSIHDNTDSIKPQAPNEIKFSNDGKIITGKAEPNSTIKVKDQNGQIIAEGKTDANGNFTVELKDPLTNGEQVQITATDAAENESDPAQATAPDLTPPDAATDVVFTDDGSKVTGKGEPDTKVIIRDKDGNIIGEGTVKPDGTFEVELDPALSNGEEVKVQLEDAAGNKSPEVIILAPVIDVMV